MKHWLHHYWEFCIMALALSYILGHVVWALAVGRLP